MLEAEIEVQEEVRRETDQDTSMRETQHTASRQHSLGYKDQFQS